MPESDECIVLVVTGVIVVVVVVSVITVVVSDNLTVSAAEALAWPKNLCIFDWRLSPGLDVWLAIVSGTLKGLSNHPNIVVRPLWHVHVVPRS